MSQDSVERFLGRVITDERFRERAMASLEQSCLNEGYSLSKAEAGCLTKLDFRLFGTMSNSLDCAIRRH